MTDTAWFLVAPLLLAAAGLLAHRRWRDAEVGGGFARLVPILVTVVAMLGAPMWWFGLPSAFPWLLPPLVGRLLAAAAVAFAVLGIRVMERPTAGRIGLLALATEVYLVPLVAAILAFHLDRFDGSRPVTTGFFAIATVLVIGAAPLLGRLRRGDPAPEPAVAGLLVAAGGLYGAFGLALFAAPATPWPPLFVWAADPLSSRLVAVMALTLAAADVAAARDRGLVTDAAVFAVVYAVGVGAAAVAGMVAGKPAPLLYLAVFGTGGLVGAAAALRAKS